MAAPTIHSPHRGSTRNKAQANGLIELGRLREADKASRWEHTRRLALGRTLGLSGPWQPSPTETRDRPPHGPGIIERLGTEPGRCVAYSLQRGSLQMTPAQSRRIGHKVARDAARLRRAG